MDLAHSWRLCLDGIEDHSERVLDNTFNAVS